MIPETDSRILQKIDKLASAGEPLLTSGGIAFEFEEHSFLIDPLCDFHPSQGINKCSQVGFSETAIIKAFYLAQHLKLNVLYTLPSELFLNDFVPPKVNKIIANNEGVYSQIRGGTHQKRVGVGKDSKFIYFQGAFNPEAESKRESTSKGTSVTTDVNIHDEANKSDPFILSQMMSRYQNSRYKGRWLFDNPSFPKLGADGIWRKSDQRYWIVTCSHCGYMQYLDWYRLDKHEFESGSNHCWIDPINKKIECGKCRREIDEITRMTGRWVAKYPHRTEHRGYWINQLMYVRHSVDSIMKIEEDDKTPTSYFKNMIMGTPYIGTDVKIERHHLAQNISNEQNTRQNCVMGIDQGKWKHWVLGNEQGIFACGKTQSWEDLERIWTAYDAFVISDALPSQYEPKKYARKMRGRFYRAFYQPERDQVELSKFIDKDGDHMVLIRRNETFDEIVDKILATQFPLQLNLNDVQEFVDHWTSMIRIVEEDKNGNHRFSWDKTDEDHFAHASLYFYIGLKRALLGKVTTVRKQKQGEDIISADTVDMDSGGAIPPELVRKLLKGKKSHRI